MRLLMRVFRRAGVELIYSKGYHPKPQVAFGPALSLGVQALSEVCDLQIDWEGETKALLPRLQAAAPEGLVFEEIRPLALSEPALAKVLAMADMVAWLPTAPETLRTSELRVTREPKGTQRPPKPAKIIEVGAYLVEARMLDEAEAAPLRMLLEWPDGGAILRARVNLSNDGGVKPGEIVEALTGVRPTEDVRYARVGLYNDRGGDLLALPEPTCQPPVARCYGEPEAQESLGGSLS